MELLKQLVAIMYVTEVLKLYKSLRVIWNIYFTSKVAYAHVLDFDKTWQAFLEYSQMSRMFMTV